MWYVIFFVRVILLCCVNLFCVVLLIVWMMMCRFIVVCVVLKMFGVCVKLLLCVWICRVMVNRLFVVLCVWLCSWNVIGMLWLW